MNISRSFASHAAIASRRSYPCGRLLARPPGRPENNLDVLPEGVQESKKPIRGETIEFSPHESRNLGLVYAEERCCPSLSKFPLSDDVDDALDQLGLRQQLLRVSKGQVDKEVAAT